MNSYERFALWSGGVDKQRVTLSGDTIQFLSHERQKLGVKVNILPVQEGSGTPSPDNVRPITGWDAVNIVRTGKNILDTPAFSIYVPGQRTYSITYPDYVLKGGTFTVSFDVDENTANLNATFSIRNSKISATTSLFSVLVSPRETGHFSATFEAPSGFDYIYTYMSPSAESGSTVSFKNIQFERSDIDSIYEPYQGDTYTITFPDPPGTVYGGVLDLKTGELRVDKGYTTVGDHTWTYDATYNRFTANINGAATGYPTRGIPFLCSAYQPIDDKRPIAQVPNYAAYFAGTQATIYVHDDRYTEGDTFRDAMSGVQIVYPLRNVVTYQLTPQEITALIGTNNIWADAGPVEVTLEQ